MIMWMSTWMYLKPWQGRGKAFTPEEKGEVELKTQVVIIGSGITGLGIVRDPAWRGVNSIIAEKKDSNAGVSGANHGLLHSVVHYVSNDPLSADECRKEGELLKKLAQDCIDDAGKFFVAVENDNETI